MKKNENMVITSIQNVAHSGTATVSVTHFSWRETLKEALRKNKELSWKEAASIKDSGTTVVLDLHFVDQPKVAVTGLEHPEALPLVLVALSYKVAEAAIERPAVKAFGGCKSALWDWAKRHENAKDPKVRKCAFWLKSYIKSYEKDVKYGEGHWSQKVLQEMKESSVVGKLHSMVIPLYKTLLKQRSKAWRGGVVAPTFEELYEYCGTFCTAGFDNSLQGRIIRRH